MLVPTFVGVYLQIPDGITCTFNITVDSLCVILCVCVC